MNLGICSGRRFGAKSEQIAWETGRQMSSKAAQAWDWKAEGESDGQTDFE